MKRVCAFLLSGSVAISSAGCAASVEPAASSADTTIQALQIPDGPAAHELIAWAALPQSARRPGPTSGQFISAANGVTPPFVNEQPIPGWSALLTDRNGTFAAMPDNGYGAKGNSADYVLGFYNASVSFKTAADGTTNPGSVVNNAFTAWNDSGRVLANGQGIELTITADRANYFTGAGAGTDSGIPVDPALRAGRWLTGYDFDVESLARDRDGSFWVGEEFGPFILHFRKDGRLLDEPIEHPFLKSPNHPAVLAGTATATLGASRGFESLAFDRAGRFLYAVPEAAPTDDALRPVSGDERVLEIFEVDPRARQYTGRSWKYQKDGEAVSNGVVIGDMTAIAKDVFVLIERDSLLGAAAVIKRLYMIDLNVTDGRGVLEKRLLVDLLDLDDPHDIGGPLPGLADDKFDMPFDSIESVLSLGPKTLAVAIDTNFPSEAGRTPGVPDSTEIIELQFDHPVAAYAPSHTH